MLLKILLMFASAACVVFLVWYVVVRDDANVLIEPTDSQTSTDLTPLISNNSWQGEISRTPGTIASKSEDTVSETPMVQNSNTKLLAEDFYQITGDTNLYEVSYDSQSGIFTITLYGSDTKKSRDAAEEYILETLPYTEKQWCDFVTKVLTNAYENPTWAGQNLGFSFCSGSVTL